MTAQQLISVLEQLQADPARVQALIARLQTEGLTDELRQQADMLLAEEERRTIAASVALEGMVQTLTDLEGQEANLQQQQAAAEDQIIQDLRQEVAALEAQPAAVAESQPVPASVPSVSPDVSVTPVSSPAPVELSQMVPPPVAPQAQPVAVPPPVAPLKPAPVEPLPASPVPATTPVASPPAPAQPAAPITPPAPVQATNDTAWASLLNDLQTGTHSGAAAPAPPAASALAQPTSSQSPMPTVADNNPQAQ